MIIGILGGTFDPPHRGHLSIARAAIDSGLVSAVWWIPAPSPPHKPSTHLTPADIRMQMVEAIIAEESAMAVSDIELRRSGPSYTYTTLQDLHAAHPQHRFRWIIGADMALEFGSWKNAALVADLGTPLVAERPGSPLPDDLSKTPPSGLPRDMAAILQRGRFPVQPTDISSSELREHIRRGEDISTWVPAPVRSILQAHNLYRDAQN